MRLGEPTRKPWDIIELICYGYRAEIIIIIKKSILPVATLFP